jgi:hypothetical protein
LNDEVDDVFAQREFVHPLTSTALLGMSVLRSPHIVTGHYSPGTLDFPNLPSVLLSCLGRASYLSTEPSG